MLLYFHHCVRRRAYTIKVHFVLHESGDETRRREEESKIDRAWLDRLEAFAASTQRHLEHFVLRGGQRGQLRYDNASGSTFAVNAPSGCTAFEGQRLPLHLNFTTSQTYLFNSVFGGGSTGLPTSSIDLIRSTQSGTPSLRQLGSKPCTSDCSRRLF
jgi:hypothetical protein